jgi:tetratricopeptide (TPR) repeat protein
MRHRACIALFAAIAALTIGEMSSAQNANRAATAWTERRLSDARSEYQAIFSANPRDAEAAYWLGRIALAENRADEGVKWMERAVALDDRSTRYHFWLGSALGDAVERASKLKQPFMAKRIKSSFERAVHLDPNNLDAREGLRIFFMRAPGFMGGSMDRARGQADAILERSAWRGHLAHADLAEQAKNITEAERRYIASASATRDTAIALYRLGSFYQRQQRWADAATTYERLLREHPSEVTANLGIARSLVMGNLLLDRAETAVKAWLAAPPKTAPPTTHAVAHQRLGQIYARTGRLAEARAAFANALELDPKNEEAKKGLAALRP